MPLDPDAIEKIRTNLELLAQKQRAPVISIGQLTAAQHEAIKRPRQ